MKANYHTHTTRCLHAEGSDEEYVLSAIKGGFDEIGFSDHAPWKYNSDYVATCRMPLSQFDDYYASISALKEKYKDQISIKIGLECEYFEEYMPWMKQFVKDKKLDYLIFGNHFCQSDETHIYYGNMTNDPAILSNYVADAIKGMESGLYAYFAHPDLFMRANSEWNENCEKAAHTICAKAKELDFILEYNLEGMGLSEKYGRVTYPHPKFWEIAGQYHCKAIVGVDAHSNESLENKALFEESVRILNEFGLEVVETIKFMK